MVIKCAGSHTLVIIIVITAIIRGEGSIVAVRIKNVGSSVMVGKLAG